MNSPVPELLARNAAYARSTHVHRGALPALRTLVVSCLDARTAPESFLGLTDGEALVMRNLGGRVTPGVCEQIGVLAALVQVAAAPGATFEIVLVHHTECGLQKLAAPGPRAKVAELAGIDPTSLVALAIHDPTTSLAEDLERLDASPLVPSGLKVTAVRYDAGTGRAETVREWVTR